MMEDDVIKIRVTNRRYFVIDEVEAGVLEGLRKIVPRMIEERRKQAA